MNSPHNKTPLKNKTAWNHLRTIRRAKEIVNSWPNWKKERVVFREKSAATPAPEAPIELVDLLKRSA